MLVAREVVVGGQVDHHVGAAAGPNAVDGPLQAITVGEVDLVPLHVRMAAHLGLDELPPIQAYHRVTPPQELHQQSAQKAGSTGDGNSQRLAHGSHGTPGCPGESISARSAAWAPMGATYHFMTFMGATFTNSPLLPTGIRNTLTARRR
jgi:hypothetical protein